MSPGEVIFRMSQLQERLSFSVDSLVASSWHRLSRFKENYPVLTTGGRERLVRLKDYIAELLKLLKEQVKSSPLIAPIHTWLLRNAIPVIARLSQNGILVGALGFCFGYIMSQGIRRTQAHILKDRYIKGIVHGTTGPVLATNIVYPRVTSASQVLIRVKASALHSNVVSSPDLIGKVLGSDLIGTVIEVGCDVSHVAVGDVVWGLCETAMQEYVVAEGSHVCRKPRGIDEFGAAVLPTSGLAALRAIQTQRQALQKKHKETNLTVLVVGGTSASGCVILQLLKAVFQSICVVTVVPYRAVPLAKLLGADLVIPSMPEESQDDIETELKTHEPIDAAFIASSELLSRKTCEKYVSQDELISEIAPTATQTGSSWLSRLVRGSPSYHSHLEELSALVEMGSLQPVLDSVFTLDQLDEAFQHSDLERSLGKSVIAWERNHAD